VYPSIESRLSNKEATFSGDVHGDRVEVFTNYISLSEWLVVQVIPHKQIFNPIRQVRNIATMTLMISMILFIAIIVGISTIFTRSLRLLHIGMKQVEAGNLDVSFAVRSRDEVGWLGKNLNTMLKKLKHQLTNEIVLERKKEQAKLEALQAQINPHFLYNTINTIKWMSILKGTESITEMLVSLGHLLNMSIHRGQDTITLEEDLRNVRYFLTIQKHRFGDTIRIEEHIDPATLDCMVPKLSLQPLVENVYQHGLFINGGLLAIRSRIESDTLVIEVADNGAGPSPDKLDEIRRSIADNTLSGIGLTNVHHRIRMMCGPPYGLDFERDDTNGMTCASIRLPVRRNNDGDSDRRD
ncbi:MAG: sensor histidine kinase, partial [Paenibacillaceae bacterium]|nr:sensor histidine kinase [Paenibacillaceae bacterium]